MASQRNLELVAEAFGSWLTTDGVLEDVRAGYEAMPPEIGPDISVEEGEVGGVKGLWLRPEGEAVGTVLYFHGGGYQIGSARSHAEMVSRMVRSGKFEAFVPDYRLSPENVFPAAIDDAVAAYRGLLASGVDPRALAVAGDSAGGGLTLATVVAARAAGDPLPACIATMSAWADLTCSGDAFTANVDLDPEVTQEMALGMAASYLGDHDASDELASPYFADFTGFPPILMQVGTDEILGDDTIRVAQKAKDAGVPVTLEVGEGLIHVYQLLTWLMPEARDSLDRMAAFIAGHIDRDLADAPAAHQR